MATIPRSPSSYTGAATAPMAKFNVYRHPAISTALDMQRGKPTKGEALLAFCLLVLSATAFYSLHQSGSIITDQLEELGINPETATTTLCMLQALLALMAVISTSGFLRALPALTPRPRPSPPSKTPSPLPPPPSSKRPPPPNDPSTLTPKQRALLGLQPSPAPYPPPTPGTPSPSPAPAATPSSAPSSLRHRPPKPQPSSRTSPAAPSPQPLLAPIHRTFGTSTGKSGPGLGGVSPWETGRSPIGSRVSPLSGAVTGGVLSSQGLSPSGLAAPPPYGSSQLPPPGPSPFFPRMGGGSPMSPPIFGASPPLSGSSPPFRGLLFGGGATDGSAERKGTPGSGSGFGGVRSPTTRDTEEEVDRFLVRVGQRLGEQFASPGGVGGPVTPGGAVGGLLGGVSGGVFGGGGIGQMAGGGFGGTPGATLAGAASPTALLGFGGGGMSSNSPGRIFRISPTAPTASPLVRKGEGELPPPMFPEAYEVLLSGLGLTADDLDWAEDHLRQWMAARLLQPLLAKIRMAPGQVMASAAKLGISVTLEPLLAQQPANGAERSPSAPGSGTGGASGGAGAAGGGRAGGGTAAGAAAGGAAEGAKGVLQGVTMDEDELLAKLYVGLEAERNKPAAPTPSMFGIGAATATPPSARPELLECLRTVKELGRLRALLRGELVKKLLPQTTVPMAYTLQRIQDLAEGSCLRAYDWAAAGQWRTPPPGSKQAGPGDLPTDSHLLLYLFAAFLKHPGWVLHQDDATASGPTGGLNPFFVGSLPSSEASPPAHFTAFLSTAPGSLVPAGALVLAIGREPPPVFALFWGQKLQACIQGRRALWDTLTLLCHQILSAHKGMVGGISLSSPLVNLAPLANGPRARTGGA